VILNYNGKKLLDRCLTSVLNTKYSPFELILVDNASMDGSVEFVQRRFHGSNALRIIPNKSDLGCAEASNVGARLASGKYIVFLDNDTEVDSLWLSELVNVMETDPVAGAAQSKLLLMKERKTIDSSGDFVSCYGTVYSRGMYERDLGQYDRQEEVFSPRSAAMIVRKEALFSVGMFDPNFFFILEDVDLGWRMRLHGYRILFVPKSIVYHLSGASTRKRPKSLRVFHGVKNRLAMLLKNLELTNLARYLPGAITLAAASIVVYIILRRPMLGLAVSSAILWNLKHLKKTWIERIRVQSSRKVDDSQIVEAFLKRDSPPLIRLLSTYMKRTLLKGSSWIER